MNKFAAEMEESETAFHIHASEVISTGILIVLPMSVITACILASLRDFIAATWMLSPLLQRQFSIGLLLVAIAIFPQFLSRIPQGFLLSQYKNGVVRRIETIYSILVVVRRRPNRLFKKNLILVALWCLLDSLFLLVMYYFALRRIMKFNFRLNLVLTKKMLGFSGFMFIELIAITLFNKWTG